MSLKVYATPLRLDLRPSRKLAIIVAVTYGCALGLVMLAHLVLWQKTLLCVLILASAVVHYQRYPLANNKNRIRALVWNQGSAWQIEREYSADAASLGPEALVLAWLVILQLRPEAGGRLYLAIVPDMLDSESFRRLRVRLGMTQVEKETTVNRDNGY